MNTLPNWTMVTEVELVYRTKIKASQRLQIKCSSDLYLLLLEIWDRDRINMCEEFKVLFLNKANKVIGVYNESSGGITGTVADPRLILAAALKALATSIVIAHNHPSGNLKPSRADHEITMKIKEGAKFFDILVIDHLILTSEGYYSFADDGLI